VVLDVGDAAAGRAGQPVGVLPVHDRLRAAAGADRVVGVEDHRDAPCWLLPNSALPGKPSWCWPAIRPRRTGSSLSAIAWQSTSLESLQARIPTSEWALE